MDFAKLRIGERYLFYHNKDGVIEYFRANYLGTHVWKKYTTLVVKNFENKNCKINRNTIYYIMNTNNILYAETLDTIVQPGFFRKLQLKQNPSVLLYPASPLSGQALQGSAVICKLPDDILREINVFY